MPYTVIQAGDSLEFVDSLGAVSTLTLPSSVTLSKDASPRFALYGDRVVMVNTPSVPLTIDGSGTVRPLTPAAPSTAPIVAAGAAGGLTGTYGGIRYTFIIKDSIGNVIAESDFSPPSNTVTIVGKQLSVSNVGVSSENISARRLYRPTTNGAVLFPWIDIDGNTITTVQDDLSDAGLDQVAAPILGEPPRLRTIAEFRGRLFGVGDVDIDRIRYTEAGVPYSWPSDNVLVIPPTGSDDFGAWAVIPRRDALGVARRNQFCHVTGTGQENSDGTIDLDVVTLNHNLGVESQETVCVFRDVAYFLWKDGVYTWGPEGFKCISNGNPETGIGQVRSWFVTDRFFNRAMFQFAFAHIDPDHPHYRIFLASAGSNVIDRFIEYDIDEGTWWGPHKTSEFQPKSAFQVLNTRDQIIPMVGGQTAVYQEQATRTDGVATAIDFDIVCKRFDMSLPQDQKVFGKIEVLNQPGMSGHLTVKSRVGHLDETLVKTQYVDQTRTRHRLERLGQGEHAQVEFQQSDVGVDVELMGFDLPVTYVGKR